jgi:hypothetical protein
MKLRRMAWTACIVAGGIVPWLTVGTAQADTTVTLTSFINSPVNTCNGSTVQVEGLQVVRITTKPDGTQTILNRLNGTGVGSDGNKYVFNQVTQVTVSGDISITSRTLLISQGSDPNQLVEFTFTTNPPNTTVTTICR